MEGYRQPEQKQTLSGIELLEKDSDGYERYGLKKGTYQMIFGFRNFGENESSWFSGASDKELDRQTPFVFDYNHSAVEKFTNNLLQNKTNFSNPESVRTLANRFGQLIESMDPNEPEYNHSLSDIVTSGRGMCDAKSTLFGSLLARHTNLEAQAITGQYGQVQDQASYPFSHQWMRITEGKNIYLFDPMYERFASFEKDGEYLTPMDDEYAYFNNLTPACQPAIEIVKKMKIGLYHGVDYGEVRLVE